MADETDFDWRKQSHDDMGSLSARLNATEQSVGLIGRRLDEFGRDTTAQFALVSRTISEVADKLSAKIDSVNTASLASRSTNWTGVLSAAGAIAAVVVSVVVALGAAVISPMNSKMSEMGVSLEKVSQTMSISVEKLSDIMVRKDDFRDYAKKIDVNISTIADRQRDDELKAVREEEISDLKYRQRRIEDEYVDERQLSEFKGRVDERYKSAVDSNNETIRRLENRIDMIDAQLVKRPEIEAENRALSEKVDSDHRTEDDRVNAVSFRANETDARISGLFPPGKIYDQMWNLLMTIVGNTTTAKTLQRGQ